MKQNAGILFHGGPMGLRAHNAYDRDGRRKYLSRSEGQKFVAEALKLSQERALFCLTLYYTGARISETLNVAGIDFDSELKTVRIRTLKKRGEEHVRRIPLPPFLAVPLLTIATTRQRKRIWPFSRTTGWRTIKAVMSAAGISGIHATSKGLRHAFGVRCALNQVPLYLIQGWMGHADSSTTAIYLAVQDEEERALMEKTW